MSESACGGSVGHGCQPATVYFPILNITLLKGGHKGQPHWEDE